MAWYDIVVETIKEVGKKVVEEVGKVALAKAVEWVNEKASEFKEWVYSLFSTQDSYNEQDASISETINFKSDERVFKENLRWH